MAWHLIVWTWLAQAALCGSAVLLLGCLAARACRQPVRRLRVIELTLLGCLIVPWLSRLSFVPHWSIGLLGSAPEAEEPPLGIVPAGRSLGEGVGPLPESFPEPVVALPTTPAPDPEPPSPVVAARPFSRLPLTLLLVAAYALAAAIVAVRWCVGLVRLRHLLRGAQSVAGHVQELFLQMAGSSGRRVRLLWSDRIDLPLTCGLFRPVILLPEALGQGDAPASLRYALAHEWSHVQRLDLCRWYLAGLTGLLFFWQPLFWWLRRQLRLGQDYLADDLAASQAGAAADYASYLVGLAKRSLGLPTECALGIGSRRSDLYRRVLMLIDNRQPLQRCCPGLWGLAAGLVAVALIIVVSAVRLDAGDPARADKEAPKKEPPKEGQAEGKKLDYSGQVTDKDTGKPIAGAVVTVRRSLYGDPEVKPEDQLVQETRHPADKDGKYHFTIPPEQSAKKYLYIELDVEAPGYAPQKRFGYALSMILKNEKMGGRPFFESLTLRPGKEISGSVETPDGKPAVGVKVLAYSVTSKRSAGTFEYGSFTDTKTDQQGRFSLTVVTPGDCVFWLLPKKYAPAMAVPKDNKRGDLGKFGLQEGIVLRGKAVDAQGKPLAGMYVAAENEKRSEVLAQLIVADSINRCALTNAKGEFELMPLPPGTYRVRPSEHDQEPSSADRRSTQRHLPAVFLSQKVKLTAGEKPEPIEVRAVPHVIVEAQYYDSKGQTRRGHSPFLFGRIDGQSWFTETKADANGKVSVLAPHGLESARLQMMTNEHGSLRWRRAKGEALSRAREIDLGTLDRDVKGIEIVRYEAPILLVKVTTKEEAKLKGLAVTALYQEEKDLQEGRFIVKKGRQSDVSFEEQEDGRFRSSQLQPDLEVIVTAHAEGYQDGTAKVKLAEGKTKEVEIVLEKK